MSGQLAQARDLLAIATEYGLPWPPKDPASVKRAYHAAMLQHHPDRGGTVEAAAKINHWQDCALALLEGRFVESLPPPRRVVQQVIIFGGSPFGFTSNGTTSAAGNNFCGFGGGWVTIRFG